MSQVTHPLSSGDVFETKRGPFVVSTLVINSIDIKTRMLDVTVHHSPDNHERMRISFKNWVKRWAPRWHKQVSTRGT